MALNRPDLQPASYNGVVFHVEVNSRASGRRVAMHEFPKRELPYAEDMGRKARRFTVAAYVIGKDFQQRRNDLIAQLEKEGNGQLILPTNQTFDGQDVVVESYSVSERRTQGYYAEFEITFCEAGKALTVQGNENSQAQVAQQADQTVGLGTGPGSAYDTAQQYSNGGGSSVLVGAGTGQAVDSRFGSFAPPGSQTGVGIVGSSDFNGW